MVGLLLVHSKELRADPVMTTSSMYGAFGPEGQRMREQLWLLPSGDAAVALRATVFRPAGAMTERHPLVVVNHGTSELNRMSVSMPVYYWLSRWFVDRGYAVVLPQRRGHGATAAPSSRRSAIAPIPITIRSGIIAAQDVGAAVDYMVRQPFVDPARVLVVGISTGGWASLALASQRPDLMTAVVNIAGGRGGHAWGRKNSVCGAERAGEGRARLCEHSARTDAVAIRKERQLFWSGARGARWLRPGRTAAATSSMIRCHPYGEGGPRRRRRSCGLGRVGKEPRPLPCRQLRRGEGTAGRPGPLTGAYASASYICVLARPVTGSRPPRYSYFCSAVQFSSAGCCSSARSLRPT